MKNETLPKQHINLQFFSLLVAIIAFLFLAYFAGDIIWIKDFQYFVTLISGIFALFVGVIALLRYYTKKGELHFLFLGIGFLGVGILDVGQVLFESGSFSGLFSNPAVSIYPFTSLISKVFLAILIFLSWFVTRKVEKQESEKDRKMENLIMISVVACFLLFIGIFIFLTLSAFVVDSLVVVVVGLVALMFYVLALLGYFFRKDWLKDNFNYWIIFMLCFLILSQIFFLPFLNLEYSNMVNLSAWAKLFAYVGLLVGFLNSIYEMFQREILSQKELAEKNRVLNATKGKVEEAYMILRKEKWDLAKKAGSADRILKDIIKNAD